MTWNFLINVNDPWLLKSFHDETVCFRGDMTHIGNLTYVSSGQFCFEIDVGIFNRMKLNFVSDA